MSVTEANLLWYLEESVPFGIGFMVVGFTLIAFANKLARKMVGHRYKRAEYKW